MYDPKLDIMGCHCASLYKTNCPDFKSWTLELAVLVHRSVGHVFDSQVVSASPLLPNCPQLDCRVSSLVYIHFANYHQRKKKLKKKMERRDDVVMHIFSDLVSNICVFISYLFCISSINVFKCIQTHKYQNQNYQ